MESFYIIVKQVQELKEETDKDAIPMSEEYKHAAEELITEKMERTFESGKAHVLVPYA